MSKPHELEVLDVLDMAVRGARGLGRSEADIVASFQRAAHLVIDEETGQDTLLDQAMTRGLEKMLDVVIERRIKRVLTTDH